MGNGPQLMTMNTKTLLLTTAFALMIAPAAAADSADDNGGTLGVDPCTVSPDACGKPIVEGILEIVAVPDTCIRDPNACEGRPIVEPILELVDNACRACPSAGPIVEPILELTAKPDTCIRDPNACEGRPIVEPILELVDNTCRVCPSAGPIVEPILELAGHHCDRASSKSGVDDTKDGYDTTVRALDRWMDNTGTEAACGQFDDDNGPRPGAGRP